MPKYIEDIPISCGEQEAAQRIGHWIGTREQQYKIKKKEPGFVQLKGKVGKFPVKVDVHFEITITNENVHVEAWSGGAIKASIKPRVDWADKLGADQAWNDFENLKEMLTSL